MAKHVELMKRQRALILGAVEIVRRQLIKHEIVINNITEQTIRQR